METYLEMLQFCRPAGNPYEDAFIERYIRGPHNPYEDEFGNLFVDVGSNPTILWSSHTDTVHKRGGLQVLQVDKQKKFVRPAPGQELSNCLGADCTTGVWLMLEMIKAGVNGRYIFHREEELGMVGSTWIAERTPEMLKGIAAAIAFDRMGTDEVITHQGGRTASDAFAASLSTIIGGSYKPSIRGIYTDTKAYASIIPECTNIGVGYYRQHRAEEFQDLHHLKWLRDRMVVFDASSLVIAREPEPEVDLDWWNYVAFVRNNPGLVASALQGLGVDHDMLKSYAKAKSAL